MKRLLPLFLLASLAGAAEPTMVLAGRVYQDATVFLEPGFTVKVSHAHGTARLRAWELSLDQQRRLGLNVSAVSAERERVLDETRRAAEAERRAAEIRRQGEEETRRLGDLEKRRKAEEAELAALAGQQRQREAEAAKRARAAKYGQLFYEDRQRLREYQAEKNAPRPRTMQEWRDSFRQ